MMWLWTLLQAYLKVWNKTVVVVFINQLAKYCHIGALPNDYTTTSVAEFFVNSVIRLHGMP